jgi:hypothetical protein
MWWGCLGSRRNGLDMERGTKCTVCFRARGKKITSRPPTWTMGSRLPGRAGSGNFFLTKTAPAQAVRHPAQPICIVGNVGEARSPGGALYCLLGPGTPPLRAVQSSPFPPCAARRRGGPGGGLGTPGLAPGPRPPRPHLRKKVGPLLCISPRLHHKKKKK